MPTQTHYMDGDNYQLRQIIFANTPKAIQQCKKIAQNFKGVTELDTCKNIFNFLKNDITYRADGGHQKVKLPSALLRERVGDCKSYSLFTGAILSNLGIPWKYVLVSYREDPTPTHIYVVTDSGIIIDAVWGKFNSEKKPTHKYYHKANDMRISTISGISQSPASKPKELPTTLPQVPSPITTIGNTSGFLMDKDSKTGIGAPRAFIWFRTMKGRDATAGEQLEWGTKKAVNSIGRELFLQLLKNNGGGLSTMLYDLVFKKTPTLYTIPEGEKQQLAQNIQAYKQSIGFKPVSSAQMDKIIAVYKAILNNKQSQGGQKIATGGSNINLPLADSTQSFEVLQSMLTDSEKKLGYDRVMGSGQWEVAKKVNAYAQTEIAKVKKKYSVTPSQTASKKYGEFENKWFWLGGDPWDLNDAIQEGATKSPRGKLFNYVIGIAQTRGLKSKDIPLLIRAVVDVITGDRFSLNDSGSYVIGKGKGIGTGEPVTTTATVAANAKLIMEIIGSLVSLFMLFKSVFPGDEEGTTDETGDETQKLAYYLQNGYLYKVDAEEMNAPKPYTEEVMVDGETLVKVDESWWKKKFGGGALTAGFGNLVIPLLIGAGALIALNTAGKK